MFVTPGVPTPTEAVLEETGCGEPMGLPCSIDADAADVLSADEPNAFKGDDELMFDADEAMTQADRNEMNNAC